MFKRLKKYRAARAESKRLFGEMLESCEQMIITALNFAHAHVNEYDEVIEKLRDVQGDYEKIHPRERAI